MINPAEMEVSPSADELDIAAHETGLSWRPGGPNSSEGKVSSLVSGIEFHLHVLLGDAFTATEAKPNTTIQKSR